MAYDAREAMQKRMKIPPSSIKNYKSPTEKEIDIMKKKYLDIIEILIKHGAKTGAELKEKGNL